MLLLSVMVCAFYAPQVIAGAPLWDGVDVHYSAQRYFSDAVRSGHLPFWTPYVFSGFPFLSDLQVGAWYPLNWPFFVAGISPRSISGELLLHGLIAAGGAYALAIRLIGQPSAGLAAAVFYALSGYFAAHSQHVGIVQTAAWLPWLLLVLDAIGERLSLARLALAGLLGAALALPGSFQAALYAFSGASVWALLEAVFSRTRARRVRRYAIGLLAVGGWGALLSAVMILPGLELVGRSLRAQVDAAAVDLGYFQLESLLTLVQPDYYGLLSGTYSGPGDVTQHYFYAGILLVPLALVGVGHERARRAALFLGLPFLWYALGPVGGLFRVVERLPGFHSVELPMHGWFLPGLGLAVLGSAGLARLGGSRVAKLILLVLFVDAFAVNALQNPLALPRQGFGFDEQYAAPLRAFAAQVSGVHPPLERLYGPPMTAVGYRNHALQSRVETTYGYNPLELALYADYAEAADANPRLVDGLAATHRVMLSPERGVAIEPNPSALPLAYFARRIVAVGDDASARARLAELDPADETVVLNPPPTLQSDASARASARVQERGEGYVMVHYQADAPSLLRVAIPFYPGWQARVNELQLTTLTVDHALLGVVVPAGEGDIRLWYAPRLFWLGVVISGLALLGTLAALVMAAISPQLPGTR